MNAMNYMNALAHRATCSQIVGVAKSLGFDETRSLRMNLGKSPEAVEAMTAQDAREFLRLFWAAELTKTSTYRLSENFAGEPGARVAVLKIIAALERCGITITEQTPTEKAFAQSGGSFETV